MTPPGWSQMFAVFGRIGFLSFGGPAAQIALMHAELVDRHKWLSEATYLRALSLCMLLPGPEAMQLATYAGWRLRGVPGGLLGGVLFVLPGAVVIAVLAMLYISYGSQPMVQAAFLGVKATIIIVVLQALLRLSRKALVGPAAWTLAALAFVGLFAVGVPYPLLIAGAGLYGALATRQSSAPAPPAPQATHAGRTFMLWSALWLAPLALLWALDDRFLLDLGLFFSKLAVVTFGGAYAVLAYMTQEVVQNFGWIDTAQMIDALGLAETTPGPLILVTEFVALLAGHAEGGTARGLIAALLALWVTFIPCFLWIFLAGPYLDTLAARPRLSGALSAITAAVVGVILNLSVWFALHVLFRDVGQIGVMPLPRPASLDPVALGLALFAGWLLLIRGWPLVRVLALMAGAGLIAGRVF